MPGRIAALRRLVKRGWPIALEAYRRWDSLSPEEKERYKKQAREYAKRGRDILERGAASRRSGRRR